MRVPRLIASLCAVLALGLAGPAFAASILNLPLTGAGSGGAGGGGGAISAAFASINGPSESASCGATHPECLEGWSARYAAQPTISANTAFTALEWGYDGTGSAVQTLNTYYVVKAVSPGGAVRQAYPNQALQSALDAALSDDIYNSSTSTISGGATNNSTLTSPVPLCAHLSPSRSVVGNTLTWEVTCAHRDARNGREVAAVGCSATDGTTTTAESYVATTTVSSPAWTDRHAVIVYTCSVDITALSNNHYVQTRTRAFPWRGLSGSILDSNDGTAGSGRDFGPRYYWKATSPGTWYVYVNSSTGNDGTCVASQTEATAAASPCATVASAAAGAMFKLNAAGGMSGGVIKIDFDATYTLATVTTAVNQNAACVTITTGPNATKAGAKVAFGTAASYRPKLSNNVTAPFTTGCMRYQGVTLTRTGTGTLNGESTGPVQLEIQFVDTIFDNGSNAATWLSNSHDYHFGTTFQNAATSAGPSAGTYEHRLLRGISISLGGNNIEGWYLIGSDITSPGSFGAGTRTFVNDIIAFNKIVGPSSSSQLMSIAASSDVTGFALLQNVEEYTSATATYVMKMTGDAATGNVSHIVFHHNTFAGSFDAGRLNVFYEDGASTRTSRLISSVGNIWTQINTKGDVFTSSGLRTGNWAYLYGAGSRGEWTNYVDDNPPGGLGTSFAQAYGGVGSSIGTSASTPQMANSYFTDWQATKINASLNQYCVGAIGTLCAGAGGGTYSLTGTPPVKNTVTAPPLAYGFDGTARGALTTCAGAYEC